MKINELDRRRIFEAADLTKDTGVTILVFFYLLYVTFKKYPEIEKLLGLSLHYYYCFKKARRPKQISTFVVELLQSTI